MKKGKNKIKHLPRMDTEFHGRKNTRKNKIKHLPRKDTETKHSYHSTCLPLRSLRLRGENAFLLTNFYSQDAKEE